MRTPGAKAVEYWLSRSHSSVPDVSVVGVPTLIWFQVTDGRLKSFSNVARSCLGPLTSPSAMIAICWPLPVCDDGAS